MPELSQQLAAELKLNPVHVANVIKLIDEGNTIPFIARYRKELHGTMDDQMLRALADRLQALRNLEKRREEVIATIAGQEKLTPELEAAIREAKTLTEVEDLYRPYRPKRRTRASIARERGLEPLAALLLEGTQTGDPLDWAAAFVNPAKEVPDVEAALAGACDILAEDFSDDAALRKRFRALAFSKGTLRSLAETEEDTVYRLYYDYTEPVNRVQSHRVLALNRGEREEVLKVSVQLPEGEGVAILQRAFVKNNSAAPYVAAACEDAWKRLIFPSVEREIRAALTDTANEQAIRMFSLNLKHLLMQPPVRGRVTLGLDPAYRTGCKIAVVDATGKLLDTTVVYPTPPQNKVEEARETLTRLIRQYGVTLISIGNGTASHESEVFVADLVKRLGGGLQYMVVNEAGASVYSASKLAAEEFPDKDVSLRSAASIARRLQDPLAELVKIDPQAIGVGQYQHDMPVARLSESLSGVVEDCVNTVGVDLNTASAPLLSRVSGVGNNLAKNIVAHREASGPFSARRELKKVKGLGPRAFEQCAGFLRIHGGSAPLDNTSVHPESYKAAEQLLKLCGYAGKDIGRLSDLSAKVAELGETVLAEQCGIGLPTLKDIMAELQKPGRDPRDELPPPLLREDVMDMNSLKPGMKLTGTVRNVIDFGVFVDIGVHQDGLVHISQLCDRYVKHPSEVCRVGDIVEVTVLEVDVHKKRISLTMKNNVL